MSATVGTGVPGEAERFECGLRADFDLGTPLDGYVAAQVERTPGAVALSDSRERLTYEEMWDRASSVAAELLARGVECGDVVGVCMERSVDLPITLLGIVRAGAAYCPLGPDQPAARLRHIFDRCQPAAVISSPAHLPLLEEAGVATDVLDEPGLLQRGIAGPPPRSHFAPDNPAYVIFTSGSTGQPKGVLVPHRGVVNRLCWMQQEFQLGEDDTVLQKTPFGFDVSVWELFWPLLSGARLHLAEPEGHLDPHYIAECVRAERVTTIHFVPSMLALFISDPLAARCGSLRRIICSGEVLPAPLMRKAATTLAPAPIFNLYGPTEASIDVTCWRCHPEEDRDSVPIGRPIANVDCFVVDPNGDRMGIGKCGELCIGGVQVALGYVGQPEATAERFAHFDFTSGPVYRTGDLVRWNDHGFLEYLGRADRQVKLNGLRIEPGEIEALIEAVPGVLQAAVVLRADLGSAERLVAYAAVRNERPSEQEIRDALRDALPIGMVPSFVVRLDTLPLTANGKLDMESLPRPV